jgi:hypothetical protein
MKTTRPVHGRFYHFFLQGSQLVVREIDKQDNATLELLDTGPDGACGLWGAALPVRLRLLHSHWLCR